MRRRLPAGLLVAGLLLLAATYAGTLHPAGDSLAVGRPFLAALLVIAGLARRGRVGWTAAAAGVLALAPILWASRPMAPPGGRGPEIVLYQKNLLFTLADPAAIVTDIRDSGADVVLLQEVSNRNLSVPAALGDALPHQAICTAHAVGAVAVLSRWPFSEQPFCPEGSGLVAARILAPAGEVTAVSLHLHWPWPFGQKAQVEQLLPVLAGLPRPVLVGGDFNAVPGSQAVRRIAAATGSWRGGPLRPTFLLRRLVPITIDHVLAPEGWAAVAQRRPMFGSDHNGQKVSLSPPKL